MGFSVDVGWLAARAAVGPCVGDSALCVVFSQFFSISGEHPFVS